MTGMLIVKTAGPPPVVREDVRKGRQPRSHNPEDRLHVSALLMGLIESRTCHIDFFDTTGGAEVERWYRRRHPRRPRTSH